jgi:ferritin-like metal-binding protein YciE
MQMNSLQDLYLSKLQMIYDAEQQGLESMPQLMQMVRNEEVRQAFQMHAKQTQEQVRRLEQLFQQHGQQPQRMPCPSMQAMIQEAQQVVQQIQDDDTRDAFLIAAEQGIEHHEIAAYGTARTWARELGLDRDADVLQETLQEEEQADRMLTQIAERRVNPQAAEADRDVTSSMMQGDMADSYGPMGGAGARTQGRSQERGAGGADATR